MDTSILIKKYLCEKFNYLTRINLKYKNKIMIFKKIFEYLNLKKLSTNDKNKLMEINIKRNHFQIELNRTNKNYEMLKCKLNKKFYQEKKKKFLNVIEIYREYILNYLKLLRKKDCNEQLLFNLLIEKDINNSITKFNIDKFYEIVDLICKILNNNYYKIYYSEIN